MLEMSFTMSFFKMISVSEKIEKTFLFTFFLLQSVANPFCCKASKTFTYEKTLTHQQCEEIAIQTHTVELSAKQKPKAAGHRKDAQSVFAPLG